MTQTRWIAKSAAIAGLLVIFAACDSQPLPLKDKQVLASVQVLRNLLGKPEGLRIMRADQYPDGAICYTYRVRNRFGGWTDDVAVYYGDRVSLGSVDPDSYFKHCFANQPARDVTDYANYGLEL
jgi:hypothetical protein